MLGCCMKPAPIILEFPFRVLEFGALLRQCGTRLRRGRFSRHYHALEVSDPRRQLVLRGRQCVAFDPQFGVIPLQAFMRRR